MKNILRAAILVALAVSCVNKRSFENNNKGYGLIDQVTRKSYVSGEISPDQEEQFTRKSVYPLYYALTSHKPNLVRIALRKDNANSYCSFLGNLPLYWALLNSSDEIIDLLIEHNVNLNGSCSDCQQTFEICSLLHCHTSEKHERALMRIAARKYPNAKNIEKVACEMLKKYMIASQEEHYKNCFWDTNVQLFLKFKTILNGQDDKPYDNERGQHCDQAFGKGSFQIKGGWPIEALQAIVDMGDKEHCDELLESCLRAEGMFEGVKSKIDPKFVFSAIQNKHTKLVQWATDNYQRTNDIRDEQGQTLAHYVASQLSVADLKQLHENGLDLHVRDVAGVTPLVCAVIAGKLDNFVYMLEQKIPLIYTDGPDVISEIAQQGDKFVDALIKIHGIGCEDAQILFRHTTNSFVFAPYGAAIRHIMLLGVSVEAAAATEGVGLSLFEAMTSFYQTHLSNVVRSGIITAVGTCLNVDPEVLNLANSLAMAVELYSECSGNIKNKIDDYFRKTEKSPDLETIVLDMRNIAGEGVEPSLAKGEGKPKYYNTTASAASASATPAQDPGSDSDEEELESRSTQKEIGFKNKNVRHHILARDPKINLKQVRKITGSRQNFLGTCENGHEWYAFIDKEGQQWWASVERNEGIVNGGVNKPADHRFWDTNNQSFATIKK